MKFIRLHLSRLRNAEYFQLMTEFKDLFTIYNPAAMKVAKFFALFMTLFEKLDLCLIILQKSGYTELMHIADQKRDSLFSGLVDLVNAGLKHFSENVRAAAKRLKIVFDTYGNLAQKPNDEQTSGINNLIQDLTGKYAADIALIGATAWVDELKTSNEEYDALVKNRDTESAEKPEEKVRAVRLEVDTVYREITEVIEALAKLADTPADIARNKAFITQWNATLERYKNRIAQRDGVNTAKKEKNDNPEIITGEDIGE